MAPHLLKTPALKALLAIALAFGVAGAAALAQGKFPERPLKMLVGFSAGGGTDVAARIVATPLGEALGQSVVVENRPGVSGLIAAEAVAKSPADGYTLMMGSQTTLAVAPNLYHSVALDTAKAFTGVALAGSSPLVLVVNPSVPAHTVADVIALAKAKPGALNFGHGGVGTTPHMTEELFRLTTGVKIVEVAYRGEAPGIDDLIGNHIPMMFANLSAVIGNLKAGTLRAIAVTSAKRSPSAPDIPTMIEQGLTGFTAETWFGIVAPAGTPRDVVAQINAQVQRVLGRDDVKQHFAKLGMSTGGGSAEEFDAYIKSEIAKWTKVIKDADIKAPE